MPFTRISSNTTVLVKRGPGVLEKLIIGTKATGAGAAVVYDNVVGSDTYTLPDGTTRTGNTVGSVDWTNAQVGTVAYDLVFSNGLTIVTTAATTPGDLTVVWR